MTNALGWIGCALLVLSLAQSNTRRLRLLNLVASAVLLVYNLLIDAPPQVVMNALLAAINVVQLTRMAQNNRKRQRADAASALGSAEAPTP